jgi:hypothetical protein
MVVPGMEAHPPTVAATEYLPLAAIVAPGMAGFC